MNAKKYNKIKLTVSTSKWIFAFLLLLLFVDLGYSAALARFLNAYINNDYLLFLSFFIIVSVGAELIFFPIDYYSEFYIEHKFNLSNQTFLSWLWEDFKSSLVGGAIMLPILLIFFYLINVSPNYWWLFLGVALFFFSVVLAQILPTIILPLFYKVEPIDNQQLKESILKLTQNEGLKVRDVYKFNMSKNTKKANAAFVGLGKTKRIILGDTLLNNFSNEEIITVIAHEIGHFKKKNLIKNIFINTLFSFATLYIISVLYKLSLPYFGFKEVAEIAALPLLALWSMVIGLITMPLLNGLSRKFEYEADAYSVIETGLGKIFKNTLAKINELNLGDSEPHPLVEWLFYSHPSIKKRIKKIELVIENKD